MALANPAVSSIVSSPLLLHPRVNKALIALVAKKLVSKSSDKVSNGSLVCMAMY